MYIINSVPVVLLQYVLDLQGQGATYMGTYLINEHTNKTTWDFGISMFIRPYERANLGKEIKDRVLVRKYAKYNKRRRG